MSVAAGQDTDSLLSLREAVSDISAASGLEVMIEGDCLRLRMYAGSMFRVSRAELSREAQADLKVLSARIRSHVPGYIQIEGHTSDEPTNTPQYPNNWYLSSARAIAVGVFLIDETGMDANRITALGLGSSEPLNGSDRAKDNRIEIIVIP
jgi:chemotaxis protein MotB